MQWQDSTWSEECKSSISGTSKPYGRLAALARVPSKVLFPSPLRRDVHTVFPLTGRTTVRPVGAATEASGSSHGGPRNGVDLDEWRRKCHLIDAATKTVGFQRLRELLGHVQFLKWCRHCVASTGVGRVRRDADPRHVL